jgi:hypothetical protein
MRPSNPHSGRYHCAAKAVSVIASIRKTADEAVAVAEENWLPARSNGLPPPLCSEPAVDSLLVLVVVKLAGILGASKICDDFDDVLLVVD